MKKLLSLTLVLALALSVFSFTAASAETKDTLVVVPYTRTENMDPYTSFDMDKIVSRQLFNSLWRYDENGVGTACLAERWPFHHLLSAQGCDLLRRRALHR